MVDFPQALPLFVDRSRVFINQNAPKWVVLHKTAGMETIEDLGGYFGSTSLMTSSHYGVGLDGRIGQYVLEVDGAAANCCPETGHADFLPENVNLNLYTLSIEHLDNATDNSTDVTGAQFAASVELVRYLCNKWRIPMSHGTVHGGIITHAEIEPLSRARCPGNYPVDDLVRLLTENGEKKVGGVPAGWKDDGKTLVAPNGRKVTQGFRQFVMARDWDPNDYPVDNSHGVKVVEQSNAALGSGTMQTFRMSRLVWTPKTGVYMSWLGVELLWCENQIGRLTTNVKK